MVSFTCDCCQEVVKKNAVVKHYTTRCRGATHFSCIDCYKTFDRRSIVYHSNCATEEEKYFGPYAKKKNRQQFQHKPQQKGTRSSSSSSSSSPQGTEEGDIVSSRRVYNNGSSSQDSSGNSSSSSSNSSTTSSRSSESSCRSTSNVGTLVGSNKDHPAVDGGVGVRSTQLYEKGPLQSHPQEKSNRHLATDMAEKNFSLQKKKQHRQEGKDLTQGNKVQEEIETSFSEQRQQQHDKRGQKEKGSLGRKRKERPPATHQQTYLQQQKQEEAKKKEETVAWQGDWLLTVQRLLRTVPQHRLPWKVLAMKVVEAYRASIPSVAAESSHEEEEDLQNLCLASGRCVCTSAQSETEKNADGESPQKAYLVVDGLCDMLLQIPESFVNDKDEFVKLPPSCAAP